MGAGTLRRWGRRLRARLFPASGAPARPAVELDRRPGRTHLVLADDSVVEAGLGPEDQARIEYLARRAVAPPPPE